MRTLFTLAILAISLTTNAQVCELDRGDLHFKVLKLGGNTEILLVESQKTGDSQALGLGRESLTIEDVQVLGDGLVLEVLFTNLNGSQKAVFAKIDGWWERLREERQRIPDRYGYSPTPGYVGNHDVREERPLTIKRRTVIQRGYRTDNP